MAPTNPSSRTQQSPKPRNMAPTNPSSRPQQFPKPRNMARIVVVVIISLLLLLGLIALITWLVVKPKRLVYTIEAGSVRDYNLTHKDHLSGTIEFKIRAYNRNAKVLVIYESFEISTLYEDQTLAVTTVAPFHQSHKNVTLINAKLVAQDIALSMSNARTFRRERTFGSVELSVYVKARIGFKVGIWKSARHTMKVVCSPVKVNFSAAEKFKRTYCDVDF